MAEAATKVYRITDPQTGQTRRVKGPADATEEELQAFAAQHFSTPAEPTPAASSPEATAAVTGRVAPPRRNVMERQPRTAMDFVKDLAVGGMKTATNLGTHVVDIATEAPRLWAKGAKPFVPGVAQSVEDVVTSARDRGAETRKFWQDEYERAGPAAFAGSMATDIAGTSGLVKPAMSIARHVLPKVAEESGRRAIGRVSIGSGTAGAAGGALTADDPTTGGIVGGVMGAVIPQVLRKSLLGINKSPQGEELLEQGVPLTTGLAATNTGWGQFATGLERVGKWLPGVGHLIEHGQQKAVRGWRDVGLSKTDIPATPHGPAIPAGRTIKGKATVEDILDTQRKNVKAGQQTAVAGTKFQPDKELEEAILRITSDPDRPLDARGVAMIRDLYKRTLVDRVRSGAGTPGSQIIIAGGPGKIPTPQPMHWKGEDVLHARRVFERYGNRLEKVKTDPFKEHTGIAMKDVADEILEMIERQAPEAGQTLKALQGPAHAIKVLRKAAKASSGEGPFTPTQLIRSAEKHGHTELEKLGRQGGEVFGNINTGVRTKGDDLRSLAQWLATAGHFLSPQMAVVTGGGSIGYIPVAQRFALGQTSGQKALVDLLRRKGYGELVGE